MDARRFESFGVTVEVRGLPADDASWARLLPPGWRPSSSEPTLTLEAASGAGAGYREVGGEWVPADGDDFLVRALERRIREHLALVAPGWVFIHAGVVAGPAGAVLIPGRSFTGKTTLVGEFLRSGWSYCSDEYAVLDAAGRVHPYPRPLSVRDADGRISLDPARLGAPVSAGPLPAAAILRLPYEPDGGFAVALGEPGEAMVTLIENAIAARSRHAEVMAATARVARAAAFLTGRRADAAEAVERLLAEPAFARAVGRT